MSNKIFTEIGFGNDTFISTETEYLDVSKVPKQGFFKVKV
jgi:hypothetical protein